MNVDAQPHGRRQLCSEGFECLHRVVDGDIAIEPDATVQRGDWSVTVKHVDLDVAGLALGIQLQSGLSDQSRLEFGDAHVHVDFSGIAALSANELVDWHTRLSALDIPQGVADS